jgi:tripeptidyl-peptidase-1
LKKTEKMITCALALLSFSALVRIEPDALLHTPATLATHGWSIVGPSSPSTMLELTFLVKQTNVNALKDALLEVSDPTNVKYGNHLSTEAVHALVEPLASDTAALRTFLAGHAITTLTPNGDALSVDVNVSTAQVLLSCSYVSLHHAATGIAVDRAIGGYSLPTAVAAAVDLVAPTVRVPPIKAIRTTSAAADPHALVNDPKTLRALYNVGDNVTSVAPTNKAAVTAFLEQFYAPKSLDTFYSLFCTSQPFSCGIGNDAAKTVVTKGDAPGSGVGSGTESMLDIEYITAMATGVAAEFWGFAGRSPDNKQNEPMLKWLTLMANTSDAEVPKLFSTSYGEDETSVSMAWADRLNTEFMKAGARGISLLVASGDSGAAGDKGCGPNDEFIAQWPSGSPYVTAVGGTGSALGGGENAASLSSGGFSNRWARPAWQKAAVDAYASGSTGASLPPAAQWNRTGRGFPDIAAQAENFVVVVDGIPLPGVAGTSCASPTASGVIALLNDARIAAGKSTLGFLNPLLYSALASGLNDVTSGSNHGCGFGKGFPAVKGWDASTGLGTPNYAKLLPLVMALPSGGGGSPCKATEFCCPDAKHCLTPTATSCAKVRYSLRLFDGYIFSVCICLLLIFSVCLLVYSFLAARRTRRRARQAKCAARSPRSASFLAPRASAHALIRTRTAALMQSTASRLQTQASFAATRTPARQRRTSAAPSRSCASQSARRAIRPRPRSPTGRECVSGLLCFVRI